MSFRVTAPLVLVRDREGKTHHIYEGGVIEWLTPDQEQHLMGSNLVVRVGGAPSTDPGEAVNDGMERPKQAAPKAVWVEYAVNGAPEGERISEDEAESMTKAELVERFG